jgi:hypothetical protein
MSDPLIDARDVLRWAQHHIATVKQEVRTWEQTHRNDAFTLRKDTNLDDGYFSVFVEDLEPLPGDWRWIIGDAISNMGHALDYIAWRLVELGSTPIPKRPQDVKFQICTALGLWQPAKHLPGVSEPYLGLVERNQPYNRRTEDGRRNDPLTLLGDLQRIHKHRYPHVTLAKTQQVRLSAPSTKTFIVERTELLIDDQSNVIEPGFELARVWGKPSGLGDPQIKMDFTGTSAIVFEDGRDVGVTLSLIAKRIKAILEEIAPLI